VSFLICNAIGIAAAHKHPTWADFGPVEWVAVVVAGLAGLWSVWRAVMLTLNPGERSPDHIKYSILNDELLQATTQAFRAPDAVPQAVPQAASDAAPRSVPPTTPPPTTPPPTPPTTPPTMPTDAPREERGSDE
jgi:hypothetical protein